MPKIGYFYLYRGLVLGESLDSESELQYAGHAEFWENEAANLFPASPETKDLRLCWYGCDRGRITEFEGRFQLLGTPAVFEHSEDILILLEHSDLDSIIRIEADDHYRISNSDAKILKHNATHFCPPYGYRYLIGKIRHEMAPHINAV